MLNGNCIHVRGEMKTSYIGEEMMDGTKGLVKVGCCLRYVSSLGQLLLQTDTPMPGSILMVIVGRWVRLSSTSHSPPLLPSLSPSASATAAALRRARTPQCKGCSSITIGARQGLVFRVQTASFSDGYTVQLDFFFEAPTYFF